MNREVHVRFWERAEVKFLRATRHSDFSTRRVPTFRRVLFLFLAGNRPILFRCRCARAGDSSVHLSLRRPVRRAAITSRKVATLTGT
jgi:hypothetical protein